MSQVQQLIEKKGGIYVNEFKEKSRLYVVFECENGHLNEKRVDTIIGTGKTGKTWCLDCTRNTVNDAHKLAEKRGFKFLSETYNNCHNLYDWKCSKGHIWKAKYSNIYAGKGCPKCLRIPYKDIINIAESKGGKCLTTEKEFNNTRTKIKLQCSEGHTWTTRYNSIKSGSWCGKCNDTICERTCRHILEFIYKKKFPKKRPKWLTNSKGGRMELDGYCEQLQIAFEFNGKQHYYFTPCWHKTNENFEWQKQKDQEKEQLCKEQGIHLITIPYTITYNDMYPNILKQCRNVPKNTPTGIDYKVLEIKSFNNSNLQLVDNYIKEHYNGKLLSKVYVNNTTKMDFECCRGHRFQQTWGGITAGIFCKKCKYESGRQKMKERVLKFIDEHNFTLLDPYTSAKAKLRWQCFHCDHIIVSSWDNIRKYKGTHC